MNRGEIKHIARAQQINNFKGLQYGKITPTDIDGCIEYKDKAYLFFELKYGEATLPYGQRLALERLVKDTSKEKHSIAIVAEHSIEDTNEQVEASECIVREIYLSGERVWRPPNRTMNLKELVDDFINKLVEGMF